MKSRPFFMKLTVYVAITLSSFPSQCLADNPTLKKLKSLPGHIRPSVAAQYGLPGDRDWVLGELVWCITNSDSIQDQASALMLIEKFGDVKWANALASLPNTPSARRWSSSVERAITKLRGKALETSDDRLNYWTQQLESNNGSIVQLAIEELGDLGDVRALPKLDRLAKEWSEANPTETLDNLGAMEMTTTRPALRKRALHSLPKFLRAATRKLDLQKRNSRLAAARAAALGEPDEETLDPSSGLCLVKMWGIEQLGKSKTPEARETLRRILDHYERLLEDLIRIPGRNKDEAIQEFVDIQGDAYITAVYRALLATGIDARNGRPSAASQFFY